jgi:hypothetical protein
MKKALVAGLTVGALAIAGFFAFHSISAQTPEVSPGEVSPRAAQVLQGKIDAIKKAEPAADTPHAPKTVVLHEAELESYVLYELAAEIPAKVDSIHVKLTPGAISADTQLTFSSNSTGNPIVDALIGGTHNLFIKGALSGSDRTGKFELQEVRIDAIPVPKIFIQTIFNKYVKPKYPDADLSQPFDLPWGIQSVEIESGQARVTY